MHYSLFLIPKFIQDKECTILTRIGKKPCFVCFEDFILFFSLSLFYNDIYCCTRKENKYAMFNIVSNLIPHFSRTVFHLHLKKETHTKKQNKAVYKILGLNSKCKILKVNAVWLGSLFDNCEVLVSIASIPSWENVIPTASGQPVSCGWSRADGNCMVTPWSELYW